MTCPEILSLLKYIAPVVRKSENHLGISGSLVKTHTNPLHLEVKTPKSREGKELAPSHT